MKDISIEFLRILAIICVVICHATEEIYVWDVNLINNLSFQSRLFAFGTFTFGRLSVPIFMFISGYLLLDREYDDKGTLKFWKNNLFPLFITVEIWTVIYNVFLRFFLPEQFKWSMLVKNVLLVDQVRLGHMWYIPMILGIYLFFPFVARALASLKVKIILIPYTLSVLYLMVLPIINDMLHAFGKTGTGVLPSLDYSGGAYGLIFITGYLYKRCLKLEKLNTLYVSLIWLATYAAVVWMQIFYYSRGLRYNAWYHWSILVLCSACLAVLGLKFATRYVSKENAIVELLGRCAFGVYFVHFPLLMVLHRYMPMPFSVPVKSVILTVLGIIISYAIVIPLSKNATLGRLLFYIK